MRMHQLHETAFHNRRRLLHPRNPDRLSVWDHHGIYHQLHKYSEGLAPPSLTLWVDRLKHDRVLAALTGRTTDSLPPLGSYFDFMDRLWTAPKSGRYSRSKLLPASWNSRKPEKPKGKKQKAQETRPKITETIANRLMDARDIPFNFEQRLQLLFYHAAILPSIECGLIPKQHLTVSGDGTAVHTHSCPRGHHSETISLYRSLELYEQQSSYNPNMPVREFMYAGKLYDKFIHSARLNRYGKKLLPLPLPKHL